MQNDSSVLVVNAGETLTAPSGTNTVTINQQPRPTSDPSVSCTVSAPALRAPACGSVNIGGGSLS